MKTKILVVDGDSVLDVLSGFVDALASEVKSDESTCRCHKHDRCNYWDCDRTRPAETWERSVSWAGEPADDNKRFGAGFEIDEPRAEDYSQRWMFESDHAAYDRFVDAGEDCVARGMEKKSNAPITKVKAIRKRIEDGPVFGVDLVGETHWF